MCQTSQESPASISGRGSINKSDEYQQRFKELFGDFSLDELLSNEDKVKRLLYNIFHEVSDR